MTHLRHQRSAFRPDGRRLRLGFTLNELLVVIALAVLVLALAVPAFNVITGGRTIESAENQLSSYLASTRAQAIGLQEPRGVLIFDDPATGRITAMQVYYPPGVNRPEIDLLGLSEEMSVPVGIGLQGIPNGPGVAYPWKEYAIIMFDGDGKLLSEFVSITAASDLGKRLSSPAAGTLPVPLASTMSNIGFVLYDEPAYAAQATGNQDKWLQENAVPFLVNRYNGTLMRGE